MAKGRNKRIGLPLWSIPCLLMAGVLLAVDRFGGSAQLDQLLQSIAGNTGFV